MAEGWEGLNSPKFKPSAFGDWLRTAFGISRPLDCVQIEVSSHCEGKCVYCPHTTARSRWQARHLEPETVAALWPLLRRATRAHLQGWGEPLLHPRFFDIAEFASRAGCKISTTSCGRGMTTEKAEAIIDSGIDMIAFSFAGTDRESNKARAGVDFEEAAAAVKILRQAIHKRGEGPQIHIAYLLLADRIEAARRLPAMLEELDAEAAIVSTLDYIAIPGQKKLAFFPGEKEKISHARRILSDAAEAAKRAGRFIYYALPAKESQVVGGGCREQTATCLYASAAGDISPCVYLNVPGSEKTLFGNVLAENAWSIWQKPEYAAFRNNLATGNIPQACLECPKRREEMSSF